MIENSLLRQFAVETNDEFTTQLVEAFDEANRQTNIDQNQAVLQKAIQILMERTNEANEY